jgi:AraC-like DNA-binding protein
MLSIPLIFIIHLNDITFKRQSLSYKRNLCYSSKMEKKKIVDTVKLEQGEYLEKKFNNYLELAKNAVDWTLFCHYKLRPNCVEGIYKILQLSNLQVAYTKEVGGVMYDFASPKESVTLSILLDVGDKSCLEEMKIKTGMMTIIQSEKIYNFIINRGVEVIDISCRKDENSALYNTLKPFADKYFYDSDMSVQTTLLSILEKYGSRELLEPDTIKKIEEEITEVILNSINKQKVNRPTFTKSELKALQIRTEIFHHMDATISVDKLAKEHNISEKSLQSAFKSLFGFTPTLFIRLMKLNLVNHELLQSASSETTILRVAQKWGFKHMGRFSAYYKELFLETPSETLAKESPISEGMSKYCVQRKEEM